MKILHCVEFYYPSSGGAQEVVRQLSERMASMGYDVTVATSYLPERKKKIINKVKIADFKISGNAVRGLDGEVEKYKKFLTNGDFDVVLTYAAQQWTTDLAFEVLDNIKAKKILVPCGYSALYDPSYEKYFKKLPTYLNKLDATIYMSKNYRDIDFAKNNHLANIVFIPNGADEREFTEPISKTRKNQLKQKYGLRGLVIMTIANYTGEKGHQELLRVFKRLPIPRATLISAGSPTLRTNTFDHFKSQALRINTSRKFIGKRVVMVNGSRHQEVRDLLKLSDIFIFFSNIECSPLVLFESAAASVPFVATAAGNSAEIAKWTRGGIIVKTHSAPNGRVSADIRDAVWQTTRLAYSPRRRIQMGRNAHRIWSEKYNWGKLTGQYLELYESLLAGGNRK